MPLISFLLRCFSSEATLVQFTQFLSNKSFDSFFFEVFIFPSNRIRNLISTLLNSSRCSSGTIVRRSYTRTHTCTHPHTNYICFHMIQVVIEFRTFASVLSLNCSFHSIIPQFPSISV